jgi:hypothetical protein
LLIARLEAGAVSELCLVEIRIAFECCPFKRCIVSKYCGIKLHCHVLAGKDGTVKVSLVTKAGPVKESPLERSALERGAVPEDCAFKARAFYK